MESARRLVIQELWAQDQYVWTAADQRAFVDVLAQAVLALAVLDVPEYPPAGWAAGPSRRAVLL